MVVVLWCVQKRHRIIDVQKKRLDKAEEGRARARNLFEELIEKVGAGRCVRAIGEGERG